MKLLALALIGLAVTPSNALEAKDAPMAVRVTAKRDERAFLMAMAMQESSNNPKAVNQFGYLGKYQFGMSTLRTMRVKTTKAAFLSNERLQDSVMRVLMKDNWNALYRFHKYVGRSIHGVKITKSGIIATAHLIGTGGLCTMFEPTRCNYPTKDGNGVDGLVYLRKFAGYDIR